MMRTANDAIAEPPPRKVFLSYTSELQDAQLPRSYFEAAVKAINRAGHALIAMEYFSAGDIEPAALCAARIAAADVYVAIVGHRYGSLVPGGAGLSYTEFEFETATELGRHRLVFLLKEDAETAARSARPRGQRQIEPRQIAFRKRLQTRRLVTVGVQSPAELEIAVYQSLVDHASRPPAAVNSRTPRVPWWLLVPVALSLGLIAAGVSDAPQQVLADRTGLPNPVVVALRALVVLSSTIGLTETLARLLRTEGPAATIGTWWRRRRMPAPPRSRLAPWVVGIAPTVAIMISLLVARPFLDTVLPGVFAASKWTVTLIDLGDRYAPRAATVAPDGDVWFIDNDSGGAFVGRMDSRHHVTRYDVPNAPQLLGSQIAVAANGTVWLGTYQGTGITRIAPDGLVTSFPVPGDDVNGLTLGPDGNVWFTQPDLGYFGKMTPDGLVTRYQASSYPYEMAAAGGQVWFAEDAANRIASATLNGIVNVFPVPTVNVSIGRLAADRAGNVWFTEDTADNIGRVSPDGTVREFAIATRHTGLGDIGPGPDGSMWFTESNTSTIGLISATGRITEMRLDRSIEPINLATAPDGSLWFMAPRAHVIGHAVLAR
jgi:streptogramin lyase